MPCTIQIVKSLVENSSPAWCLSKGSRVPRMGLTDCRVKTYCVISVGCDDFCYGSRQGSSSSRSVPRSSRGIPRRFCLASSDVHAPKTRAERIPSCSGRVPPSSDGAQSSSSFASSGEWDAKGRSDGAKAGEWLIPYPSRLSRWRSRRFFSPSDGSKPGECDAKAREWDAKGRSNGAKAGEWLIPYPSRLSRWRSRRFFSPSDGSKPGECGAKAREWDAKSRECDAKRSLQDTKPPPNGRRPGE